MALVTITSTIGTTCYYWLSPEANVSTTGNGVTESAIQSGWITPASQGGTAQLSVQLDNSFAWDVYLDFQGAPPIRFEGFNPGNGGDLLTLLTAQGWVGL